MAGLEAKAIARLISSSVYIMVSPEAKAIESLDPDIAECYSALRRVQRKTYRGLPIRLDDINDMMASAASDGRESDVRHWHDCGATDNNAAMVCAARSGHESIVRLCHEWGATCVSWAMASAANSGHENIVQLCREWIAATAAGAAPGVPPAAPSTATSASPATSGGSPTV